MLRGGADTAGADASCGMHGECVQIAQINSEDTRKKNPQSHDRVVFVCLKTIYNFITIVIKLYIVFRSAHKREVRFSKFAAGASEAFPKCGKLSTSALSTSDAILKRKYNLMKKILAAILFFGSVGTVAAQFGQMDPYAGLFIGPPEIWRQPGPSCGYTEMTGYFSKNPPDVHCESPWHTNVASYFPNPLGAVADRLKAFKNANPGKTFELVDGAGNKKGSCNSFVVRNGNGSVNVSATQASCNGARMRVRREVSLAADVWSVFRGMLGVTPAPVVAPSFGGATGASRYGFGASADSAQGCEFYEVKEYKTIRQPKQCPVQDQCETTGARMMMLQMEMARIEGMSGISAEEKARKLAVLQMELGAAMESCSMPACEVIHTQIPMPSPTGSGSGVDGVSCQRLPCCFTPGSSPLSAGGRCNPQCGYRGMY